MSEERITFDREFVAALERDPEEVLKRLGLEPTDEVKAAIKEMDFESLRKLADAFSGKPGGEVSFAFP